jgi:drug/metabolite transporter (DMT)-like permease
MFYLTGSIILTSYLTLSFKVVEKLSINIFQAIVFNYISCVITGSLWNGRFPISAGSPGEPWFKWAILMGASFIIIFNMIGITAQRISVAVASVANKLSLVIPFLFSLYLYHEKAGWLKVSGLILALVAVLLTCWPFIRTDAAGAARSGKHEGLARILIPFLPVLLFISSGLLDTMVKYVEAHFLKEANKNDYLISAFLAAALIGSLILVLGVISRRQKFDPRSMIAGLCIGVPNYFSIWCLLNVLQQYAGNSSAIIPINNMGIVLFSSVMAVLLFKEHLSVLNWTGIILSLGAIALIAFG